MNECLHPLGGALRNYAWILDQPGLSASGSQPAGTLLSHTRCYGFSGAGDGTWDVLMVHGTLSYDLRQFTWSLLPAQYEVYDTYGNIIPQSTSSIVYSGEMLAIRAKPPLSLTAMQAAFAAASFTTAPDTVLPNLVIVGYPPSDNDAVLENHRLRLRWIAWDNIDYLVSDNVFGMSFRWRLVPSGSFETFSPWTQKSFVELTRAQVSGNALRVLTVDAMDKAGNIDTKSVQFNW